MADTVIEYHWYQDHWPIENYFGNRMKNRELNNIKGFTLIELITVLSILAISITLAVPSFKSFMQNNQASSEAHKLLASFFLARSEAVKRGVRVTMCPRVYPRTNPETCTGSNQWSKGWLLYIDESGVIGDFDSTDVIIKVWDTVSGNPTLVSTSPNLQFQTSGDVLVSVDFTLTMPNCAGQQVRNIDVSVTGRAMITKSAC